MLAPARPTCILLTSVLVFRVASKRNVMHSHVSPTGHDIRADISYGAVSVSVTHGCISDFCDIHEFMMTIFQL